MFSFIIPPFGNWRGILLLGRLSARLSRFSGHKEISITTEACRGGAYLVPCSPEINRHFLLFLKSKS